jgi:hypothetical protein
MPLGSATSRKGTLVPDAEHSSLTDKKNYLGATHNHRMSRIETYNFHQLDNQIIFKRVWNGKNGLLGRFATENGFVYSKTQK